MKNIPATTIFILDFVECFLIIKLLSIEIYYSLF